MRFETDIFVLSCVRCVHTELVVYAVLYRSKSNHDLSLNDHNSNSHSFSSKTWTIPTPTITTKEPQIKPNHNTMSTETALVNVTNRTTTNTSDVRAKDDKASNEILEVANETTPYDAYKKTLDTYVKENGYLGYLPVRLVKPTGGDKEEEEEDDDDDDDDNDDVNRRKSHRFMS